MLKESVLLIFRYKIFIVNSFLGFIFMTILCLKESLKQCQHPSPSIRNEALFSIRELVCNDQLIIRDQLWCIFGKNHENLMSLTFWYSTFFFIFLDKMFILIVDSDSVVRSSFIKVLKTIFPQVSSLKMSPFFETLSAHLCCAMTHIHDDVQVCILWRFKTRCLIFMVVTFAYFFADGFSESTWSLSVPLSCSYSEAPPTHHWELRRFLLKSCVWQQRVAKRSNTSHQPRKSERK